MEGEVEEPRVLVVIPNTGNVHIGLAHILIEILGGTKHQYMFIQDKPVENVRNKAVLTMRKGDFDYLLMIDSDTVPTKDPLELVAFDKDVMICPTLMFKMPENLMELGGYPFAWNAMDWDEGLQKWREHIPRTGLQEIDAGGTGCILIARRVLENPEMRHPFTRVWDKDGQCAVGSDLFFCKRAKDEGFTVWAHYDYRCRHVKPLELMELQRITSYRDLVHMNNANINTPEYWDDQWAGRGEHGERKERILPYYEQLAEMCKGQKVLDFGCGRGDLLAMLDKTAQRADGIDHSQVAVDFCRGRGLNAELGTTELNGQHYDTILATEVMEHLDDDAGFIRTALDHCKRLIYAVPFNCLPPSIEPEHQRCYTRQYVQRITPHLKESFHVDQYLVVVAERESDER